MRCEEFELHAAQWLEGERTPETAGHLQSCTRCSTRMADLELIVSAAATLPELDPPERIWTSIRTELEREGLFRERKSVAERVRQWLPALPRTALATAALSALAVLLLLAPQSQVVQTARHVVDWGPRWNMTQVSEQLASGETLADQDVHLRDPEVVQSYQHNLALVDNVIGECQKKVNEDPGDELSRQYLATAYQQKAELLTALAERDALGD
ncbi:MAG TPA: hypothetical protein VLW54_12300 [Candidatus Acidoferrales bacterium]|nr:hypothetical protein [Candidatus Acidoferrales bacterium]